MAMVTVTVMTLYTTNYATVLEVLETEGFTHVYIIPPLLLPALSIIRPPSLDTSKRMQQVQ